jgi:REP element-mobilizing transposase RayT
VRNDQAFKSITTHEYLNGAKQYGWRRFNGKLWQRNYYERVMGNDIELNRIRKYIAGNPAQWASDLENTDIAKD